MKLLAVSIILMYQLLRHHMCEGQDSTGTEDLSTPPPCCKKKEVETGDSTDVYNLIESNSNETEKFGCLNSCVYTLNGTVDRYCFGPGNDVVSCIDDPEQNKTSTPHNLNRLFIAYADTGKHIIVNLNTGQICDVPYLFPFPPQPIVTKPIINLAAVNYLDGHGIVACGGLFLEDSRKCHLFNGKQWNPLPDSKYTHCYHNTKDSIVQQGRWFVTGQDQTADGNKTDRTGNTNGCSDTTDIRVSEVLTYDSSNGSFSWTYGPDLKVANGDVEVRACLAQLDENTSVFTGGFALDCTDPTVPACKPGRPGDRHHLPNKPLKETWQYFWQERELIRITDFTTPRYVHGCALLKDQGILIAGGYTNNFTATHSVEILFETTWFSQPDLPATIADPFPTLLTRGDTVIALFVKESQIFSTYGDGTWTPLANVNLDTPFGNGISRFDQDRAVLIPDDFIVDGCP